MNSSYMYYVLYHKIDSLTFFFNRPIFKLMQNNIHSIAIFPTFQKYILDDVWIGKGGVARAVRTKTKLMV